MTRKRRRVLQYPATALRFSLLEWCWRGRRRAAYGVVCYQTRYVGTWT